MFNPLSSGSYKPTILILFCSSMLLSTIFDVFIELLISVLILISSESSLSDNLLMLPSLDFFSKFQISTGSSSALRLFSSNEKKK